jgi:shikimate dehydrogenase
MHNAVFEQLGLNWRYLPLPVRTGEVEQAVRGLAAMGFRGANVTVPHKQAVIPMLRGLSADASVLGAVNTLLIDREGEESVVDGHNTDSQGFIDALEQSNYRPSAGSKVVLVGAGGAARGVLFGLLNSGVRDVLLLNRDVERAEKVVQDMSPHAGPAGQLSAQRLSTETLVESVRRAELLVNATSVGMWPQLDESIWPEDLHLPSHLTVYDLVYNPLETHLLRQAKRSRAQALDGLGMLVRQGALSLDLWTGMDLDIDQVSTMMRQACEPVLRRR